MSTRCIISNLEEDRDGFRFRGGSPVLDLTATLQARRSATPRELLETPRDLDRWLTSAGISAGAPGAMHEDLECAWTLREAIFDLAGSVRQPSLDANALVILNRIAADTPASPQLTSDGEIVLQGSAHALLVSLACDAVALFGSHSDRIRHCCAPACSIYFLDTSRSGQRRWCSMAACGNKAKVAALRGRNRSRASKLST